jgi:hypothetical protein
MSRKSRLLKWHCATRPCRNRRGIALAVALFALMIIGSLVAGIFSSGWLEQQSGQNTVFAGQAAEAAEAGLGDVRGSIAVPTLDTMTIGGAPLDLGVLDLGGGVSSSRQVSRLTSTLFLIRAQGRRSDAGGNTLASRTIGSLVRLLLPDLVVPLAERGWVQLY